MTEIILSKAIDINGVQTTVINMREPLVSDQIASDKMTGGQAEKEIFMFANLCDLSPNDFNKMSLKDYRKVQKAFLDLIAD